MKNYLKAALAAVLALVVLTGLFMLWSERLNPQGTSDQLATVEQMEKNGVPDFSGKLLSGAEFHAADVKGKVAIVNFWASWCGPCVQEIPSLTALVKAMSGDLELIAISEDESREDVEAFIKAFPELRADRVHVLLDEDRSLMKAYSVERMPESFIINPSGRLVKKIVGGIEWHTQDSEEFIRQIKLGSK